MAALCLLTLYLGRQKRQLAIDARPNARDPNAWKKNKGAVIVAVSFAFAMTAWFVQLESSWPNPADITKHFKVNFWYFLLFEVAGIYVVLCSARKRSVGLRDEVYRLTMKYGFVVDQLRAQEYCTGEMVQGAVIMLIPVIGVFLGWSGNLWVLVFAFVFYGIEYFLSLRLRRA